MSKKEDVTTFKAVTFESALSPLSNEVVEAEEVLLQWKRRQAANESRPLSLS